MDDGQDRSEFEQDAPAQHEVVDGVVVLSSVRTIERARENPPPFVQAAAVAATGFVAGAATAAVLGRRLSRSQARRAALARRARALARALAPRPGVGRGARLAALHRRRSHARAPLAPRSRQPVARRPPRPARARRAARPRPALNRTP